MTKEYAIKLVKAAGIRALKTMLQTAVGVIGTSVLLEEVNWAVVGSASLLAGIVSFATNVAIGLPEVETDGGSK